MRRWASRSSQSKPKPSTPTTAMVKNTSEGLKVLRASMITWPMP
jgi:hypothetical protein